MAIGSEQVPGTSGNGPKALGTLIKASEVQFHHEVTNQFLWSQF